MRALRVVLISLGVITLAALAAAAYLLGRQDVPEQTAYRINVASLRNLAASVPGAWPESLHHQPVALAHIPRAAVFAGESFDPHRMMHGAYQVNYADGFILVDAAMTRDLFEAQMAGEGSEYDSRGREVVASALERATAVVITHEHADHLNGITAHPRRERFASRVRLNPEPRAAASIDPALREAVGEIQYDEMFALAPGVVLLRAPGHTPGTQMVYVALQDGSEWLLLGDVAWHMRQIEELHYRPRLVTDFFLDEDRGAVLDQFRALYDLMKSHPEVLLVSSHDVDQRAMLVASKRLGDGFE
jgi:glyoxylase-like metal-dependent hydrolase (beta-lactamase superfamily II)